MSYLLELANNIIIMDTSSLLYTLLLMLVSTYVFAHFLQRAAAPERVQTVVQQQAQAAQPKSLNKNLKRISISANEILLDKNQG